MKLQRMIATFGKLNRQTLELAPGLNILEAPNESGKSTWCAFLLAMLYGVDSRQRDKAGILAEKNRYAPWCGAAMAGQLECTAGGTSMTLQRQTRRPAAPMGEFTARLSGTTQEIPGLTGQNCGETLLGVPREVYERSAFIRQAGAGISSNAELERRIAALVTSGEEDTSFSEAYASLKKQLNRRRHNRTGELPAAEEDLRDIRRRLEETAQLHHQLQQTQAARDELQRRRDTAKQQLTARLQADAAEHRAALESARTAAETAARHAAELHTALAADRIPGSEALARFQGAAAGLKSTHSALEHALRRQEEAEQARRQAEYIISESPFAGLTPEQAEKLPLELPPKPRAPLWLAILAATAGAAFGYLIFSSSSGTLPAIGGGCGLFGIICLALGILTRRKQCRWEEQAEARRAERGQELSLFTDLWTVLTETRAEADRREAAADALRAALSADEQEILTEIRHFSPGISDITEADAVLQDCIRRRKAADEAQAAADAARIRAEILGQQITEISPAPAENPSAPVPDRSADQLRAALEQLEGQLAAEISAVDRLTGSLSAAGDPDTLAAQASELERTVQTLTAEYEAIATAMSALEDANTELQTRFSPALGRRAAEHFRELTGGRYSSVLLDRTFRMATGSPGDTVYRDAQFLSAGTADQLYLAVRLAICDLVLPSDTCPPIVLDDALANYDDERCAAALRLLRREAEHRQILLFTCHSREAEFFRNDPAVRIQRLTDAVPQV